ncbi:aminopeptidase N [Streptomyces candidus]|uniref:Aminopeptidase N n=1 Tax=Streptomyces candidus TaxID=67283 RepID=A0A7X0H9S6_9ACTN|nr:aminopeptidase N [Streptomyces candidus]MBB6433659.1 aminopeptidase N [Streptomyces candidus]GHH35077.1 aminopeptidase [Streptomyces candidus]
MPVLTRDEAQTRARHIDVQRYTVDLDLTTGDATFDSRTVIHFTVHPTAEADAVPEADATVDTFAELKPAVLRSVTLDGHPLDPTCLSGNRLPLTGLAPGTHELSVDAAMHYSRTGEGMHRFTDPADGETYVYTQLFLDDVQRVFAAFDQPDLKAVFDVSVTAPAGWTVLGNSIATRQDNARQQHAGQENTAQESSGQEGTGRGSAGQGSTGQGNRRWVFASTPLISTYLVAVAAGPWHSVRTEHAGLPFGIHCRRSLAPHLDADADEILGITRACYDRFHEKFDEPYPFDSYDQAFVPEFNAGAMENPGLVTFRDEYIFRSAVTDTQRQTRGVTIAHEMAHMWFGDLVTLQWWDDIWLNESFAEYMGYQTLAEATRFQDTWTSFAVSRKGWGYDADQRPSTHPVAPDAAAVPDSASALLNFDGISYAKGASALRQLVAWMGEKDFLAGINTHFARHRFANATLADFIDNLASATDRDVHAWAQSWLRTTGVDTLTPTVTDIDGGWTLDIDHSGSRPHRITVGAYDHDLLDPDALVLRERFELDVPAAAPTADGAPDATAPDTQPTRRGRRPALLVLNDGDQTYAKVRLDPTSWRTVLRSLSHTPDPLTRAVLWNAARDMVRDGQLPPTAYLDAARAHLPHETDLAVVQGVLAFAADSIADHYLAPEQRPAALAALTGLCRDLIRRTEDGNDPGLRLTAVRHFIDAATQPDSIRDWYDSEGVPGGPLLDPELRWRILHRLAVLGATDEAAIDAELARDPSATGEEGAARCRAALPTREAKTAAWEALFSHDDLSNYLFAATAQGFWQPEQADLLQPYAVAYYPAATALASRRGPAIAEAAGRYAFPAYEVTKEALALGEKHLDDADLTPALRRKLVDQLDDLRRALAVRSSNAV